MFVKMIVPKLFLHIGVNKTGTSYIQYILSLNYYRLVQEGFLYPLSGRSADAHYELSYSFGFSHGSSKPEFRKLEIINDNLLEEIKRTNTGNIIISSEYFMLPKDIDNIKLIKDFFEKFDCHVVIYLRRHDYWWQSNYSQAVKTVRFPPWGMGFEEYYKYQKKKNFKFWSYKRLVDDWAKVFGREKLIIRSYEDGLDMNIVDDFTRVLGIKRNCLNVPQKRLNESLSYYSILLLDIYQRLNIPDQILNLLINHALLIKKHKGNFLSPQRRRELVLENIRDYEYISQKYLGGRKLFKEYLPDPNEFWIPPEKPTIKDIIEESIKVILK